MSRTKRGSKSVGYDYWSKRPYSQCGYGKDIKTMTKRKEREQSKTTTRNELEAS